MNHDDITNTDCTRISMVNFGYDTRSRLCAVCTWIVDFRNSGSHTSVNCGFSVRSHCGHGECSKLETGYLDDSQRSETIPSEARLCIVRSRRYHQHLEKSLAGSRDIECDCFGFRIYDRGTSLVFEEA